MKKKIFFALLALNSVIARSSVIPATGTTITTGNTLYYSYPNVITGVSVDVNTTVKATTAPLAGFGVYMNNNNASVRLNDAKITTSGSTSDAVRFNGGNNYFFANTATITSTGSQADGVNIGLIGASTNKNINIFAVDGKAEITGLSIAARANNYAGVGSKSILMLGDNSIVKSTMTGAATNSTTGAGYGVYAGTNDVEQSGMGTMDKLSGKSNLINGNSYVFIGDNSTVTAASKNGHAVFSNQAGIVQLGNNANIEATGAGGYALYAESKATKSNGNVARGATIYLDGGARLRANNSSNVIQANGKDAIIKTASIVTPTIDAVKYVAGTDVAINTTDVTETSGVFDIIGNLSSTNGGTISLGMSDGTKFIGSTSLDTNVDSKIDLNLSGANSVWEINKDSSLTSLTLENGAVLTPFRNSDTESTSYTLTGNVINQGGTISLGSPSSDAFDSFTINGNYTGATDETNAGTIIFETVLNADNSNTDSLVITGDASGYTKVKVENIGGLGDQTIEGIKLIDVLGTSQATFIKDGRIVAGSYDYTLRKGGTDLLNSDSDDWYLSSYTVPIPKKPVIPAIIKKKKVFRPESGSYISNLAASNTLFVHGLHERLGEPDFSNSLTNKEEKVTGIWVRNTGGHNRFNDNSGQLETEGDRYVLQLGGDIAQLHGNNGSRFHLGLMGGYATNSSTTDSKVTGYSSDADVSGYSLGTYGTWYANNDERIGLYTDLWAMYSWFDNDVHGEGLAKEKYDSSGITTSAELGYTFKIDKGNLFPQDKNSIRKSVLYIQPKAQLIYMGVDADKHTEKNGTVVKSDGEENIQTRLGARLFSHTFSIEDTKGSREYQPFLELNWIHNTEDYGVVMNNVYNYQDGASNLAEIKIGTEVKLDQNLSLWGNFSQQYGENKYRDSKVTLGTKYSF